MDPSYMYPNFDQNQAYGYNGVDNNYYNGYEYQNQYYYNQSNFNDEQSQNMYQPQQTQYTYGSPVEEKKRTSDSMPHPLNVNFKDFQKYYGQTIDSAQNELPPLISTTNVYYTCVKNCTPNFMRSTLYAIPNNSDLQKKSGIPIALVIQPLSINDNFALPFIDHGKDGPIRCRRCGAYMNPNITFINGGKNFNCNICACVNEVPDNYFCNLDQMGTRLDQMDRPELNFGSYDLNTNEKYFKDMITNITPLLIFCFDVSYACASSGLIKEICNALSNLFLNNYFDFENRMRVGFIAYDTQIYLISPINLNMEIVSDLDEPFISSYDFFVDPAKNKDNIINLLSKLPQIFCDNKNIDIIFGPLLTSIHESVLNLKTCAQVFIFHGNLPNYNTHGQILNSTDRAQLEGEDEKKILNPQNNFYLEMGKKFLQSGIGVNLFLFPNGPVEIATLAPLCSITGGVLKLFKYFKSTQGYQLAHEISKSITSLIGLDVMAKIRCSNGLSVKGMFGNITNVNESEILISHINSRTNIVIELIHDEKLGAHVYFQFAILYTTLTGRRIIRVHNLCIPTTSNLIDIFKNIDNDALSLYYLKYSCKLMYESSVFAVKTQIIGFLVKILSCYRQFCVTSSSSMQLVLPENIKLLPLYMNCMLNLDCISGGKELTPDDKCYALFEGLAANFDDSNTLFYSRVFDLSSLVETRELNPIFECYSCEYCVPNGIIQVRASYERLEGNNVYLLENGTNIFIWFGKNADPQYFYNLFGSNMSDKFFGTIYDHLPAIDSDLSKKCSNLVSQIRKLRKSFMRIYVCQQDHKSEYYFKKYLSEDKNYSNNSTSYVEFLCVIHQEIRKLLND